RVVPGAAHDRVVAVAADDAVVAGHPAKRVSGARRGPNCIAAEDHVVQFVPGELVGVRAASHVLELADDLDRARLEFGNGGRRADELGVGSGQVEGDAGVGQGIVYGVDPAATGLGQQVDAAGDLDVRVVPEPAGHGVVAQAAVQGVVSGP